MHRVAAFLDGPNVYASAKALGVDLDYKAVLAWLRDGAPSPDCEQGTPSRLVRATYYTTVVEDDEYVSIKPLVDWLEYNGWTLVTKPAKVYTDQATGRVRTRGSMDVEMAIGAVTAARDWRLDEIVIMSGDGDLAPLVEEVKRLGVRVTVVAALTEVQPAMISDDLRRAADRFVDLAKVVPIIGRKPGDRRPRRVAADGGQ